MKWGKPIAFSSIELDHFLERWVQKKLSPGELKEWSQVLIYDSSFREAFCDWIKALREPALSSKGGGLNDFT